MHISSGLFLTMSVGGKVVRKRRKATEGTHLEFSPTPGVFVAPASTHTSRERPPVHSKDCLHIYLP